MCWPCCWPCLVVESPPLSQHPNSHSFTNQNSGTEKFAPRKTVSRRRAFGEIAASKGFASQPRASRRSHSTTRHAAASTKVSTLQRTTPRRPRSTTKRVSGAEESVSRQAVTRRRTLERVITTAGHTARQATPRPSTAEDDITSCPTVSSYSEVGDPDAAEEFIPRQIVPITFDDAPDAWLTPSMVGLLLCIDFTRHCGLHLTQYNIYLTMAVGTG